MVAKLNKIRFTANGTFVCPAGVTLVTLEGCGGGGGGGGGEAGNTGGFSRSQCSGGGGGGAICGRVTVAVTPGTSYGIVIGQGGTGGTNAVTVAGDGADGTDTQFDSIAAFLGGAGARGGDRTGSRFTSGGMTVRGYHRLFKLNIDNLGTWVYSRFYDQQPGVGGNGMDLTGFALGFHGDPSFQQQGGISFGSSIGGNPGNDGADGSFSNNGNGGGGGGCSGYPGCTGGNGGFGGSGTNSANGNGANAGNGGNGVGFGAGGGGGGSGGNGAGSGVAGTGGNGGNGSNGFLDIMWYE